MSKYHFFQCIIGNLESFVISFFKYYHWLLLQEIHSIMLQKIAKQILSKLINSNQKQLVRKRDESAAKILMLCQWDA